MIMMQQYSVHTATDWAVTELYKYFKQRYTSNGNSVNCLFTFHQLLKSVVQTPNSDCYAQTNEIK